MLTRSLLACAILLFSLAVHAQQPADAPKAPDALQKAQITIALKDYEIATLHTQLQQAAVEKAQAAVMSQIAEVKKQLGLDDTWDFNFQSMTFVRKTAAK